jgi:hypothetical protein
MPFTNRPLPPTLIEPLGGDDPTPLVVLGGRSGDHAFSAGFACRSVKLVLGVRIT